MGWTKRFYHYDGQGSTQLLTDENGNVTDSYANTAFGTPVDTGAANPTVNPFRFVGQFGYYLDLDTGDYYVRARTYSPFLARWLNTATEGVGNSVLGRARGSDEYRFVVDHSVFIAETTRPTSKLNLAQIPAETKLTGVNCGQSGYAAWDYRFDGKGGAPCTGYVVQRVQVFCTVDPECKNCPTAFQKTQTYDYYEAFRYPKGDPDWEDQRGNFTDLASFQAATGNCGAYRQNVDIKFFCEDKNDPIAHGVGTTKLNWPTGQSHGTEPCVTKSDDAPSTDDKPGFWGDRAVLQTIRDFTLIWDCCPNPCGGNNSKVTVDANPKPEPLGPVKK
jgi:hypothetical protein